jgi:predicted MFS family arabinose efflux permease
VQAKANRLDGAGALRLFVIGLIAFLTLVDLFATQAILPSLVRAYGVAPAEMGVAVNASTLGMAAAGLAIALLGRRLDRRRGVALSLALLSIPTLLLAASPALPVFAALRIVQGLLMSTAFGLTLAHLSETGSGREAAAAAAAYVTGNVASNLFGRLMAASIADHLGLAANFQIFAALNLAGALLAYAALSRGMPSSGAAASGAWRSHLADRSLRAAFAIGFCILFAFIGTFTYVNFVLTRPPFAVGMMQLGLVYFVFLPALLTTPFAGRVATRIGTRPTFAGALAVAGLGLPLMLTDRLELVLAGMVLVAAGTFFAQAAATGFVGRAARSDRAAAGGLYLASYFLGGLVGSYVLGKAFDSFGWGACVAGIAISLSVALLLASRLRLPEESPRRAETFC